jgi:Tetratricopeptide repeat
MVAQDRGRLDEAEGWCRKSLTISEELGDKHSMAPTFGQLGLLAGDRGQPRQALEWMVRCVTLFGEFPHQATGSGPWHLARLTKQLGMDALEESWQQVTGNLLPANVRGYVASWSAP